ncbi:MAG TPA: sialidase family protein [Anaerolineales bacterium]|nr:sialidase family protein [Anaerolineales bacterium]
MKRFYILMTVLLLGSLACGATSPETLDPTQTLLPTAVPSTPLPTDEPVASQALVDEAATEPPSTPAPVVSPQPAVARYSPGDAIVLDRITMIDAQNGWAVSGGDVLFTTDGARTWREVTPPEALPPESQVQAQGVFLDAWHAWIVFSIDRQIPVSAVVWWTEDGGHTWAASAALEHQVFGEQVWAEGFALDADHVWLLVRGVYVGAGTHHVAQLLRSTNGGFTWSPMSGDETFDYNYDYTGMAFADGGHGLVTWQTTGAYAPGPPNYAMTSDGANTWTVHELPPPADKPDLFGSFDYCEPFQPHFLSQSSIRMLVGCFDAYDPPRAFNSYFYSSEDGGATWTSALLPEKVPASQDILFFFDEENALLVDRTIYRSTNGGKSWDPVKSVAWDGQFSFVDPQTGWAIAHSGSEIALVKTSNGGATWSEIKPVIAP